MKFVDEQGDAISFVKLIETRYSYGMVISRGSMNICYLERIIITWYVWIEMLCRIRANKGLIGTCIY